MPAPARQASAARQRAYRKPKPTPHRARRLIVLTVVIGGLLGTLLVTAFGQSATREVSQALPGPSSRLLPVGPPMPLTVALHSGLRIQLPVAQSRVTAIGYHASGDGALPLSPLGRQGNEGAISRLAHKIFGGGGGGFVYYQLSGGETAVLDVGAVPGTDVYAPVDGTIVGISDYVLNGQPYGKRHRHPTVGGAVARRLADASASGPGAQRRLDDRRVEHEGRSHHRSLGRGEAGARQVHAGRGEPRFDRAPPRSNTDLPLRILFVADVVGGPGRRAVEERLPSLKEELHVDFCILNGENLADGVGITPKLADKMLAAGADVITLGNHVWRRAEIKPYLDETDRLIRPANLSARAPGKGMTIVDDVAVINLLGSLFINPPVGPFEVLDDLVEEARRHTPIIVVDFHGEATSEKVAAANWLDGKVTAVIGTHTHVQTNDARVQRGGTAALTDAGMTGPHDSVIGVQAELAIRSMRTGIPVRFETASGDVRIEGALVECDAAGRATSCETVRVTVS